MSRQLLSFFTALLIPLAVCRTNNNAEHVQVRNAKAKELQGFMKLNVDPCQDFYEYVCGNWTDNYKVEENKTFSMQNLLEEEVITKLKTILDSHNFVHDNPTSKARNFYKSCLNIQRTLSTRRGFLVNFLKEYGGMQGIPETITRQSVNWIAVLAKLRANIGVDALIGFQIDKNLHNGRGNSIFLGEPQSTLIPADLCSEIAAQNANLNDESYRAIEDQVAYNMKDWFKLNDGDAKRFAGEIVSFEFQLCKKMRNDHTWRVNEVEDYDVLEKRGMRGQNRLHGNRGQVQYPRQNALFWTQRFGNVIDFNEFLKVIFGGEFNDQFYITSEAYIQHLANVIKMGGTPTTINYILYRALERINFPDSSAINRPKYCVEFTLRYFTKIIGVYLQRSYRGDTKEDVEFMFREIKNVLQESVRADWMSENTKNAAVQKLIPFKVGFPVYQNIEVLKENIERIDDFWYKLEIVIKHNAKIYLERLYNFDANSLSDNIEASDTRVKLILADSEVIVSWGVLQAPLYNYFYPNALKFSVLGQQMAKELSYAFDEQGWSQNYLSPQRYDEYAAEGFRNQSECFRAQYSNYLYNNPQVFRNASKIRDIMADSSGLNIAFKAYLNWLQSIDPVERSTLMKETLPDVNFTNSQLFFIHFAQARCIAKYQQEIPPDYMPLAKHTIERFDVNGPLSNNEEFSREFNCVRGTPMNPDDKCVLYT